VLVAQSFGASLNVHHQGHFVVSDGVYARDDDGGLTFYDRELRLDEAALNRQSETIRTRVVRQRVRKGFLESGDADDLLSWDHHGGRSLDTSVSMTDWGRACVDTALAIRLPRAGPPRAGPERVVLPRQILTSSTSTKRPPRRVMRSPQRWTQGSLPSPLCVEGSFRLCRYSPLHAPVLTLHCRARPTARPSIAPKSPFGVLTLARCKGGLMAPCLLRDLPSRPDGPGSRSLSPRRRPVKAAERS
jgi:hypothetical protein